MKKLLTISVLGLLSIGATASTISKDDVNNLSFFKKANMKVEKVINSNGIYHLDLGQGKTAFLTKDKKTVIFGRAFNTANMKELTIPIDIGKVDLTKEAFEFGNGKDEYIVFTDPECPYCKKFEQQWESLKDHVKFHVFLFPLSFHKDAKKMSLYILSQKTNEQKAKALSDISAGKRDFLKVDKLPKKQKQKLIEALNQQRAVANTLGVKGTPTMFSIGGNKVNWSSLQSKYNVTIQNINPKVFLELMKKSSYITHGKGNKKLFVFSDVDMSKDEMNKIDMLAKTHELVIFLKPINKSQMGMFKTLYILEKHTSEGKFHALKEFVKGKKLTKEELQKIKKSIADLKNSTNTKGEIGFSPLQSLVVVGYAIEQLHLPQKTIIFDENGKIHKF